MEISKGYKISVTAKLVGTLDLLQVDLLVSGASLFGRKAADGEQQSRERSTCLACRVFYCISRQKWGLA